MLVDSPFRRGSEALHESIHALPIRVNRFRRRVQGRIRLRLFLQGFLKPKTRATPGQLDCEDSRASRKYGAFDPNQETFYLAGAQCVCAVGRRFRQHSLPELASLKINKIGATSWAANPP
jgi:hypothetical protein